MGELPLQDESWVARSPQRAPATTHGLQGFAGEVVRYQPGGGGVEPQNCSVVPPGVKNLKTGCGRWEASPALGEKRDGAVTGLSGGAGTGSRAAALQCPGRCRSSGAMPGAKGVGAGPRAFHVFLTQISLVWFRSITYSQCFLKMVILLKNLMHLSVREMGSQA